MKITLFRGTPERIPNITLFCGPPEKCKNYKPFNFLSTISLATCTVGLSSYLLVVHISNALSSNASNLGLTISSLHSILIAIVMS